MIDHFSLPVSDVDRSRAFYDRCLAPLGGRVWRELEAEGYRAFGYHVGEPGHDPMFWIGGPPAPGESTASPPGQHLAFAAPSRAAVDAFYKEALAAGGKDNGPPGLRPQYHSSYYAAFVLDPDEHRIEAVCHEPE